MKHAVFALLLGFLVFPGPASSAEVVKLPRRAEAILDELIPLGRGGGAKVQAWSKYRFSQLVVGLCAETDPPALAWARANEGRDLRAKLMVIARDYISRPEFYREINEGCFDVSKGVDREVIVLVPKQVPGLKIDETCRLPFEMWLLAPPQGAGGMQYHLAALGASIILGKIGNPLSLPVFERLIAAQSHDPSIITEYREAAIVGLIQMPSPASLALLLDCLDTSAFLKTPGTSVAELEASIKRRIVRAFRDVSGQPAEGTAQQRKAEWAEVFARYPQEKNTPVQQAVFDEAASLLR